MTSSLADLESLDAAMRRGNAEAEATKAIGDARSRLVLGVKGKEAACAFFAATSLKLKPVVEWDCPTMATDGRRLLYNPEYVLSLTPPQLMADVCHETMHNVLGHHTRRAGRDLGRWNTACDLAIGPILDDAGFDQVPGSLMPGEDSFADLPRDQSAEWYHEHLPQDGGNGRGRPGNGPGEVIDATDANGNADQAAADASAADWRIAAETARRVGQQRGELPGSITAAVVTVLKPRVDWQSELRDFLTVVGRNDFSWARPSRRSIACGVYLPHMRSEELGPLVILADASGSISDAEYAQCMGEVGAVIELQPAAVHIVFHTSQVQGEPLSWEPMDPPPPMVRRGYGGTDHIPAFERIEAEGWEPAAVVALTDLETRFPKPPPYPVLWVVPPGRTMHAVPFGRAISMGAAK
jgi:predicted metal-dependent peptidase